LAGPSIAFNAPRCVLSIAESFHLFGERDCFNKGSPKLINSSLGEQFNLESCEKYRKLTVY
jgi:hypothetical protein